MRIIDHKKFCGAAHMLLTWGSFLPFLLLSLAQFLWKQTKRRTKITSGRETEPTRGATFINTIPKTIRSIPKVVKPCIVSKKPFEKRETGEGSYGNESTFELNVRGSPGSITKKVLTLRPKVNHTPEPVTSATFLSLHWSHRLIVICFHHLRKTCCLGMSVIAFPKNIHRRMTLAKERNKMDLFFLSVGWGVVEAARQALWARFLIPDFQIRSFSVEESWNGVLGGGIQDSEQHLSSTSHERVWMGLLDPGLQVQPNLRTWCVPHTLVYTSQLAGPVRGIGSVYGAVNEVATAKQAIVRKQCAAFIQITEVHVNQPLIWLICVSTLIYVSTDWYVRTVATTGEKDITTCCCGPHWQSQEHRNPII